MITLASVQQNFYCVIHIWLAKSNFTTQDELSMYFLHSGFKCVQMLHGGTFTGAILAKCPPGGCYQRLSRCQFHAAWASVHCL